MRNNLTKLSEIIDEISMGPFGSDIKVENFVSSGIPVLNGSNLTNFRLVENEFKYVTKEKAVSYKKAIARRGDIVITHRGTLGQVSFIPENSKHDFYVISQSQFRVKLKKDRADSAFIVYYFHTLEGQRRLLSFKNHVGVPALAQATTNFRLLQIPLPELSIQQKIAAVLSALDAKIELNNQINAELEKMAKTIYDYWFVQFDFPDANGKPYKSSGGKMVWNEELKREIPEGWEVKEVKDFLNVITGKEDANFAEINGKYPFFTCGEGVLKCNKSKFKGKVILVAGNGNFNVKYFDGEFNAYQRTYVLIPSEAKYVGIIFRNVFENISKFKISSNGSIVKFIRKEDVEKIKVILPKNNLKILEIFNQNIDLIQKNLQQNQALVELRDWLLPMLMNGQVKVE